MPRKCLLEIFPRHYKQTIEIKGVGESQSCKGGLPDWGGVLGALGAVTLVANDAK